MSSLVDEAAAALHRALDDLADPVSIQLVVPRRTAEKLFALLEAERSAGAVVVPLKETYTTTEAARMLGISRPTLMKLLDAGELESELVGTHHRIRAQEILAFERDREASRGRAAEAMTEFSDRVSGYQSNVSFRANDRGVSGDSGEGGATVGG